MDPLTKAYPELTPYQYASNSPIDGIDIDGLEVIQYTLAKQGVYGPTAAKIINGTEDGVKASLKNTWNFFAKDAWRAQTWINAGKFIEQGALSMSAVPVAPTPMIDAKADEFINDVIRGDAYTRSAYISEFGTGLLLGYIGDKGLGKLKGLSNAGKIAGHTVDEILDVSKGIKTRGLLEEYALSTKAYKGFENANITIGANNPGFDLIDKAGNVVDVTSTSAKTLNAKQFYDKLSNMADLKQPAINNRILQIYVKEGQYTTEQLSGLSQKLDNYIQDFNLQKTTYKITPIK